MAHRKLFEACGFSEIVSIARDSDACRIYTIRVVIFPKFIRFQNGKTWKSVIIVKFFLMENLVYSEILTTQNA